MIPLLTMIPVRSQWGRYNLPRNNQLFSQPLFLVKDSGRHGSHRRGEVSFSDLLRRSHRLGCTAVAPWSSQKKNGLGKNGFPKILQAILVGNPTNNGLYELDLLDDHGYTIWIINWIILGDYHGLMIVGLYRGSPWSSPVYAGYEVINQQWFWTLLHCWCHSKSNPGTFQLLTAPGTQELVDY